MKTIYLIGIFTWFCMYVKVHMHSAPNCIKCNKRINQSGIYQRHKFYYTDMNIQGTFVVVEKVNNSFLDGTVNQERKTNSDPNCFHFFSSIYRSFSFSLVKLLFILWNLVQDIEICCCVPTIPLHIFLIA